MRRKMSFFLLSAAIVCLQGCSYVETIGAQSMAELSLQYAPSQITKKGLIRERNLIVYGKIKCLDKRVCPVAVAAFSNKFGKLEVVDFKDLDHPGYYTLCLPLGQYQIFVFADINNDSMYRSDECVGYYKGDPFLEVNLEDSTQTIINAVDIQISSEKLKSLDLPFSRPVRSLHKKPHSAFYPSGSLRTLDDEIFSPKMGVLGLYNPSAFLSQIDMYFYALRERDFCKIPVVFVHGISGTPRDWKDIVEGLDSARFDPWFFYYPTGEDLDKVADIFYEIFFSGRIIDMQQRTLIVIAHSMGGLVARAAINKYAQDSANGFLKLYVSICTPYGGVDAAAGAIKSAPLVINSWRDVATGSKFVRHLQDTRLPESLAFHLLFAYRNDGALKNGPNSDGTITLASQLAPYAQFSAKCVHGYNETHTSILQSKAVFSELNTLLSVYKRLGSDTANENCIKQEVIQRYHWSK